VKGSVMTVNIGVGVAKSKIKVENRPGYEWSAEDFYKNVSKITDVGMVVIIIISHHSARACR